MEVDVCSVVINGDDGCKHEIHKADITPHTFTLLQRYLNDEAVTLEDCDVTCDLLWVIKKYHVPGHLLGQCRDFLTSKLAVSNVWRILERAQGVDEPLVSDAAWQFVQWHTSEAIQDPGFLQVDYSTLERLLMEETLKIASEQELYEASVRWVRHHVTPHDLEMIQSLMQPLLKHLRLLTLRAQTLANCTLIYDIVSAEEVVALFKNINVIELTTSDVVSNVRTTRNSLEQQDFMDGEIFHVNGVQHKIIPTSETWSSFKFSSCAVAVVPWFADVILLGVQCPSQIRPAWLSSSNIIYEEDVTLLVYDKKTGQIIAEKRYNDNTCYNSLFDIEIPPLEIEPTETEFRIIFHKAGKYPYKNPLLKNEDTVTTTKIVGDDTIKYFCKKHFLYINSVVYMRKNNNFY